MRARPLAVLAGFDRLLGEAGLLPSAAAPSPGRAGAVLAALAGGLLSGAPGLAIVLVVVVAVVVRGSRRRAQAEQHLLRELNDTVPLLQLAVGAGLTVRAALVTVSPWSAGRLGTKLTGMLDRSEAGASLADELDRLPDQLGETCRGLASVLSAGERYGSPLVEPLALLGSELRLQRRHQLEQAARRVPVRLLFPLALGVLPAFVLLAVVPLAATALEGLTLPGG